MYEKFTLAFKDIKDRAISLSEYMASFSLEKQKARYFIILTRERTGSTCLLDLLSSHSKIKTNPHVFYNYTSLPHEFGREHIRSNKSIFGFKFKIQPSSFDLTAENLSKAKNRLADLEKKANIIYLERENLVRQSVSWLLADLSRLRKQNYRRGQKPIKIKSMRFEPDLLLKKIQKFEKLSAFERSALADIPHLHLKYEQDILLESRHQLTLDKICDFLDIKPEKSITRYARLSSEDLSKSISNYQEIYEFLKETKYFDSLTA